MGDMDVIYAKDVGIRHCASALNESRLYSVDVRVTAHRASSSS